MALVAFVGLDLKSSDLGSHRRDGKEELVHDSSRQPYNAIRHILCCLRSSVMLGRLRNCFSASVSPKWFREVYRYILDS